MPDLQVLLDHIDRQSIEARRYPESAQFEELLEHTGQLAQAVRAVLELHQKTKHQRAYGFPKADQWEHYCVEDNQTWPCPTVQAITEALGSSNGNERIMP